EVSSTEHAKIFVHMMDGKIENYQGTQLPKSRSQSLFERRGEIEKIIVYLPEKLLYKDVE
ncbi:hypothetical protein CAG54_00765, partial [Vibrio sp. V27_P1S3P104]